MATVGLIGVRDCENGNILDRTALEKLLIL